MQVQTQLPAGCHKLRPSRWAHLGAREGRPLVAQQRRDERLLQHVEVALAQDDLQRVGHVALLVLHRVDLAQRE
jgi:hypothetical protein